MQAGENTSQQNQGLVFTESAAVKVKALIEEEKKP